MRKTENIINKRQAKTDNKMRKVQGTVWNLLVTNGIGNLTNIYNTPESISKICYKVDKKWKQANALGM